ncbi:MAG TPA: ABC transporter permease subunit [Gaiellaceae bacterium]|nr:ABC transporter permease subunit [Gaiellaceae bacterium]
MSLERIGAVVRKELRDFRRNRFLVGTMAVLPFVFLISPTITLLRLPASSASSVVDRAVGGSSLLLFVVPAVIPPIMAAYSVIGERDQGTLEPFLTTPIRREELLLAKALAVFIPSVAVAYGIYFAFALVVRFGAAHVVSAAVWHTPQLLAQLVFTPLIATWAIWVGIAMSVRARDVRVAQQLATLASLPMLGITTLITFRVIEPSVRLAVTLAAVLLVIDIRAWRFVSKLFDRERLITGTRRSS